MPKAKTKGRKKINRAAPAAAAPIAAPASIAVGARVKVKAGEWGNATGTVSGLSGAGVLVRLDSARNLDPQVFEASNLIAP